MIPDGFVQSEPLELFQLTRTSASFVLETGMDLHFRRLCMYSTVGKNNSCTHCHDHGTKWSSFREILE